MTTKTNDNENIKLNILFYDRLKVGQLITISTHKYELVSNLKRLGHNVVLLNSDYPRKREDIICGNPKSVSKGITSKLLSLKIFRRFRGSLGIVWTLNREVSLFLSALTTVIKHKMNFDVIYRRHNLFNSDYLLARLFGIPVIKEVNGLEAVNARITGFTDSISLRIIDWLERLNLRRANKIIVVSSKLKETLHNDYAIPMDKIVIIPNGADIELFKPMDIDSARRQTNLPPAEFYVVFVGDLVAWHGPSYLIESIPIILKECPKTKFLIVGDGMLKQELVETANKIGVSDYVIFTGMVPYSKVPIYINSGDICVGAFIKEIGKQVGASPLKIGEYMSCGKPVVASRISGLEILEENEAGILVEPESPSSLAQAIIKLLQDKELRCQMGMNGRKYMVQNHSWECVARGVVDVMKQTVRR
jgi:glycosyltransferase involved in cell wall biosynthesis